MIGETRPNTITVYTYTVHTSGSILGPVWAVTGGTVVTSGNTGLDYWANVQFTTPGAGSVTLKNKVNTVFGTLSVVIEAPTVTPSAPQLQEYQCNLTVLSRGTPPTGATWYWQTSSTGTSTTNSAATYAVSTAGTTVYLRAKSNSSSNWSAASSYTVTTVYSTSVGGTVTSSGTSYYNTGSGQLTLQGNVGAVKKWQRRAIGGSWADVSGSAGLSSIAFTNLQETTDFVAVVANGPCAEVNSTIVTVTVSNQGFEGKIIGTTQLSGASNSGLLQLMGGTGTIAEWQYSDNGLDWTSIASSANTTLPISNLASDRYYRVKTAKGITTSYTTAYLVRWYPSITGNIASENYVQQDNIRVPLPNSASIPTLTSAQKTTSYTYRDGLGRPVQSVTKNTSPDQNDVVSFNEYDAAGRQTRAYLPYVASGNSFYSNTATAQTSFYNTPGNIVNDSKPYADVVFDGSPLNRIIEHGAPGNDWQPGSGHTVRKLRRTNTSNEIRIWKADGTSPGYYTAGTLTVEEITDENNNKTIVYSDNAGRRLQKHVQVSASEWLKTLYIYDKSGQSKYTVQPEGVRLLASGTVITTELLDKFTFQFSYDERDRLVEKKVPGSAPIYIAYDPLERPVLIQDGNLRDANKWYFIKYDAQGRGIMQGTYRNTTQTTRSSIQSILDGLYTNVNSSYPVNSYYEDRGVALHGYTNQSFPMVNYDNSPIDVLVVNYYDNYDFDNNGTDDFSYVAQGISGEGVQGNSNNLPTGAKRVTIGGSTWIYQYMFYDKFGKVIQVRGNNHLRTTIDNLTTNVYDDYAGKLILQKAYHNTGLGSGLMVVNTYEYDHVNRLSKVFQSNNSSGAQLLAQYKYNELGQLIDKKLHATSTSKFLQSVDYRYNIRGWLNSINNSKLDENLLDGDIDSENHDYFGMDLLYNNVESEFSNTALYNGGLSAIKWKSTGSPASDDGQQSYRYAYDKAGRLTSASSNKRNGTSWNTDMLNENMTYDYNGNIKALTRNYNNRSTTGLNVASTIDELVYTYNNGNQLSKVKDAKPSLSDQIGFRDDADNDTEYTYNTSGSLTSDLNKGIQSISYNIIGKAQDIIFTDGRHISYIYDAAGNKLATQTYSNSEQTSVTDYVDGFVYENKVLQFFSSPEGRVVSNAGNLEYQYNIADHQGNTRVIFTANPDPVQTTTENFETAGSNRSSWNLFNRTTGGTYSQLLNGGYNSQVGLSKSFKVYPGDKVNIEAYAKFYNNTNTAGNLTGFASALLTAFGMSPPSAGEVGTAASGLNTYGAIVAGAGDDGSSGYPKAFVNILLFDKDYNFLDIAYEQIDGGEQVGLSPIVGHDHMFKEYTVKEAGYAFVFISNENPTQVDVYFDDVTIAHTPGNIVQYNEYYPFGLQTDASWTREGSSNNYLYNGGSELNHNTNWYEMASRGYDPVLGRMFEVDPEATSLASYSPYNYALNSPADNNDPNGDYPYNGPSEYEYLNSGEGGWQSLLGVDGTSTADYYGSAFATGYSRMAKIHAMGANFSIGTYTAESWGRNFAIGNAVLNRSAVEESLLKRARNGEVDAISEYARRYGLTGNDAAKFMAEKTGWQYSGGTDVVVYNSRPNPNETEGGMLETAVPFVVSFDSGNSSSQGKSETTFQILHSSIYDQGRWDWFLETTKTPTSGGHKWTQLAVILKFDKKGKLIDYIGEQRIFETFEYSTVEDYERPIKYTYQPYTPSDQMAGIVAASINYNCNGCNSNSGPVSTAMGKYFKYIITRQEKKVKGKMNAVTGPHR